jgi:hypothetical protein
MLFSDTFSAGGGGLPRRDPHPVGRRRTADGVDPQRHIGFG